MSNFKSKAKTVYYTLGFFVGLVLMLFIALIFPVISVAVVLMIFGGIAWFLAKQYAEYQEIKNKKGSK